MNSKQIKDAFKAAGIKVRVANFGKMFRICRIEKPGVDLAHDQLESSKVAASLGLTDSIGNLGGQYNQPHELVTYNF